MATQKIHFFTGKGGVGKSVISAAFALSAAKKKSAHILLAELAEESAYPSTFSRHLKPEQWTVQSCLEEYASNLLHSNTLSKLLLNNRVSQALINVAPGLQDLAILGKATAGPRQHGPKIPYDEIFIDAFASGHFRSLMSTPESFAEVFSIGPIATQSRSIDAWIKNSEFCSIHIVTQADELTIQESVELFENLKMLGFRPHFILNKFVDTQKISIKKLPHKTRDFFENIQEQQTEALKELKKTKSTLVLVPFVFEQNIDQIIQRISREI